VQDGLIEAKHKRYIDEALFDRLWTLTRRALGTNTNLMKYLRECVRTGAKPWLNDGAPKNPGTKNPGT
jgi:hypothetical protein